MNGGLNRCSKSWLNRWPYGDGGRQGAGDGEQRCLVQNILGQGSVKTLLNHSKYPKSFVTDVSQCKIEFKFFNSSFLDLRTPYLQNDRNQETQKDSMTERQTKREKDEITNRWKEKKSE